MKRETKFVVLKLDDLVDHLDEEDHANLMAIIVKVNSGRVKAGKKVKQYVCVADNWPMYEATWQAIENWVDGEQTDAAAANCK